MIECGSCSPLPAPSLLPGRRPAPSLHDRAPIRAAAAIRLHSALDLTALGGQRSPRDHATVAVAAVVLTPAGSGHAGAGPAVSRAPLIPRPRWGGAGGRVSWAVRPPARE